MLEFLKEIFSVRKTHDELEMQFAARTAELSRANELLKQEVNERKRVEETIKNHLAQLSRKNRYETIISTVTRSVHQSINLQEVLENAAEAMYTNIEGVDYIAIYLVEGEEAVSQWKERNKRAEFPLFPGYVFINTSLWDRHRDILNTRGIVRVLGVNGTPTPVPTDQIDAIRKLLDIRLKYDIAPTEKRLFA